MTSSTTRPDVSFLFAHPAHFIALGFGAGLSPIAPGTVGTLVALPIAWWLGAQASDALFLAVIAAFLIVGVWASQVTGRHLGVADHGSIVVDEVAAFLLVLFFVGSSPLRQAFAFLLFRVFDIVKPPPIGYVDATMKNGAGVMLDDLLAAGYTLLVLAIAQRTFA
jgi:phosphatidylglycerophosphatase A